MKWKRLLVFNSDVNMNITTRGIYRNRKCEMCGETKAQDYFKGAGANVCEECENTPYAQPGVWPSFKEVAFVALVFAMFFVAAGLR